MLYSCCAECGIADKYGKRGKSPFSCSELYGVPSDDILC